MRGKLHIGLSETGITLVRSGGWLKKQSTVLAERSLSVENSVENSVEHPAAPAQHVVQLRSMLTEFKCQRCSVTIVLSDALVRLWSVTPPPNTVRLSDCQAATTVRFQSLYGEALTDWALAADWDARQQFMACAMPRQLLQALLTVAQEHQLTVLDIVPLSIASWNRWHADLHPAAWFGVLHDNVLTLAAPSQFKQRRLSAIRALPFPKEARDDKNWLQQNLKREALRMRVAMPSQLQLCGAVPQHWVTHSAAALRCTRLDAQVECAPISAGVALAHIGMTSGRATPVRINFAPDTLLRTVVQTPAVTWLFGAAGVALCVASLAVIFTLMNKNSAQKVLLERAETQLVERTARKAPPKKFIIPDAQVSAMNAAILQLNLPWSDVLNAIEDATPATIALLALEPDAKKQSVKGMAEAKSSGEMIVYIEQLKKQAFFGNVALTKYEVNDQDSNKPTRFQFEAQWKEAVR